jgi:hypothetical protein
LGSFFQNFVKYCHISIPRKGQKGPIHNRLYYFRDCNIPRPKWPVLLSAGRSAAGHISPVSRSTPPVTGCAGTLVSQANFFQDDDRPAENRVIRIDVKRTKFFFTVKIVQRRAGGYGRGPV